MCLENPNVLDLGDAQAISFRDIKRYSGGSILGSGSLLTTLCSFVWLLIIVQDVYAAVLRILAALALLSHSTSISSAHRIEGLGPGRVAWFVTVQLARLTVAMSLAYGGVRFLSRPISPEGLMRTTVALKCAPSAPEQKLALLTKDCRHAGSFWMLTSCCSLRLAHRSS